MAKIMIQVLQHRVQSKRAIHVLGTAHEVGEPLEARSSSVVYSFQII